MPPVHWDTIITSLVSAALLWGIHKMTDLFKGYQSDSATWRKSMDGKMDEHDRKLDAITDATQTTMRTDLIHLYEKYTTRGWLTPEERAAWHDMHTKYAALNANGLIDSYGKKLDELPDREI